MTGNLKYLPNTNALEQRAAELEKENERLKKRNFALERLIAEDELTGLHNRNGFLNLLARQCIPQMYRQVIQSITVGLFDMDNLKGINDKFGHYSGDIAIKAAAQNLQNSFREEDVIARLHGDEFAVAVINASDRNILKRFGASRIPAVKIKFCGTPIELTMSGGFAELVVAEPNQKDMRSKKSVYRRTIEAALHNADKAMYLAKSRGKNQFCFFKEL